MQSRLPDRWFGRNKVLSWLQARREGQKESRPRQGGWIQNCKKEVPIAGRTRDLRIICILQSHALPLSYRNEMLNSAAATDLFFKDNCRISALRRAGKQLPNGHLSNFETTAIKVWSDEDQWTMFKRAFR